jgi:hypothetical protein
MECNKLSSKGAHFAVGVLVAAASVYLARDIFTQMPLRERPRRFRAGMDSADAEGVLALDGCN